MKEIREKIAYWLIKMADSLARDVLSLGIKEAFSLAKQHHDSVDYNSSLMGIRD